MSNRTLEPSGDSHPAPATSSACTNLLDALFYSAPLPTWIADLDGRYTHVSSSYANLLGRRPSECVGRLIDEVMPPAFGRLYLARHQQLLATRKPKRFEQIWPIDGEVRWYEIHMSCLLDASGAPAGVAGQAQDITVHMEQQEAARQVQITLERRVAQRTSQLSSANEELTAFSYSVSHDLRAPLGVIIGFADLLDANHHSQLDDTGRDYLNQIRTSAQRMNGLIGDLLRLSRISEESILRTRTDLVRLSREILEELALKEPHRNVQILLPESLIVDGDPGLLRALLVNLLSNAWKFTGRTPDARIELNSFERSSGRVIYVRDNGAGFDMQHAGRMFGAFQRFHRESDFPGTGIGLATVKRIVSRHNGQIWAEGALGAGATFYFTLEAPM